MKRSEDDLRLPVKLDSTSNGEFAPVPLSRVEQRSSLLAWTATLHAARRTDAAVRQRNQYPELTPALKCKVFGLNGARVCGLDAKALRPKLRKDPVGEARAECLPNAGPDFRTCGPRNRREFLAFKRASGEPD